MKDAKYLIAYLAPLAAFGGLYFGGVWSLGSFYVAFVLIPIFELVMPGTEKNLSSVEEDKKSTAVFFDLLLYLNIPILYGLLIYYFSIMAAWEHSWWELAMMTVNVGVIVGAIGINVGHELGHRRRAYERTMAKMLLLPAMYMHFYIEHNRGHHKHVATDADPASARRGESIYRFWLRSIVGSYLHAWQLEGTRLQREGKPIGSTDNAMIWFQLTQALYLLGVGAVFGWWLIPVALFVALEGVVLLETVNYIEHYGLRRKLLPSGRYEQVLPRHSWNSNHELGRIFLYELTRHSDHHFKATRKYQVLRHFEDSPQLPLGYPASMILALVPPLWFRLMDKELQRFDPEISAMAA